VERPYIYNVRSTPRNIKSLTGSRDLQMVDINLRVIYRPMVEKLPDMYRTLGMDYDERVRTSHAPPSALRGSRARACLHASKRCGSPL
jgi:hypothetical protein